MILPSCASFVGGNAELFVVPRVLCSRREEREGKRRKKREKGGSGGRCRGVIEGGGGESVREEVGDSDTPMGEKGCHVEGGKEGEGT
ncbi:hypothetical protein E2C01_009902 [Portunus trituberculatus]|uniref:Uncharacterized protein n=1 Tax=Portunus trituberculatus TaxID=210409 RepID=A0A5B7D783_PORTR|nr:hypothetical protein [Portunus trituberculatus]